MAMLSVAITYPGSLIPIARKNLTELKRGTLLSFHEAAGEMNFTGFHENRQELTWTLDNGSILMFLELDHTKDRQFSKIKSINATCAMIDEEDGIVQEAHIALFSRTGRRNKNGAPAFILGTCNPNEAWLKSVVYDPWVKGELPPDMKVIEFEPKDSFLGDDYYQRFQNMPATWKERYLYNNWNYGDDDASLFKYRHMDRQHVETYSPALRYLGSDVARSGRDRSVTAMWEGPVLVDIQIIKDTDEVKDTGDQGDEVDAYASENAIGSENIAVDAVGLGVGQVDRLAKLGRYVHEFMSGSASQETVTTKDKHGNNVEMPLYNNKRSEIAFKLSRALEDGEAFLYSGCPFLTDFKKEATMHNYASKDKQLILEPKDKVKERLGHSPDIFDAVIMGYERYLAANAGGGAVPTVGGDYKTIYGGRMTV